MKKTISIGGAAEIFSAILLAAALAVIQTLIGGTRLLFSLPAYALLAGIGLLSLFLLRRAKPGPDQFCLLGSAAFFGYVLGRALLSPVPYIARADIHSVLGGLLVYFFVALIFTNSRQRIFLFVFLLAGALVHVLIGAIQFRGGDNFMLISFLQRHDYGRRASGFYVCPNHLAGLLEVLGVFGLSIVCWSRFSAWIKILIAYAVGVCYVGLILTGSRGGYLSAAASLAVFGALSLMILRRTDTRLFWKIGGAGLIATILILVAVVSLIQRSDYLSDRASRVFDRTNMRRDLWQAAIQQWQLDPVFGTGSGTYLYYGRQFRTDRVQMDPVVVHNDYLHLLAEYGLVGSAGFLIFLAAHLRAGWKNFQQLGPRRVAISPRLLSNGMALNVGAISAVAAYAVHSIVDFNLHIPANVLLLAFVFGILANAGTPRGAEPEPLPGKAAIAWRLLLPLIGVIVVIQCVRLLPGEYLAERARTALRDNHPVLAIHFAQRGLATEGNNPNLYRYLASARIVQGDSMSNPEAQASFYRAAIPAIETARALAPRDNTFALGLGFVYDKLGRFEEAESMYGEAMALDPKSRSTRRFYEMHLEQWQKSGAPPAQGEGPDG